MLVTGDGRGGVRQGGAGGTNGKRRRGARRGGRRTNREREGLVGGGSGVHDT